MTMREKPNDLLLLAGNVLTIIIQAAMAFVGVVVAILIPIVLFFGDTINAEIQADQAEAISAFPAWPMAGLFVLIIGAVALTFLFFGKLRAIIGTVSEQDPFVPGNADRLNAMAWLLLATQLLMIPISAVGLLVAEWAAQIEDTDFTFDGGFDLTSILMVIILFILARVFKHGAEMRDDLEGTV